MNPTDETIEILKNIHFEMRGLRSEVGGLRDDFGGMRDELGGLRGEFGGLREQLRGEVGGLRGDVREMSARIARIERRQVDADVRLSTEIVSAVGVMQEVRDLLRDNLKLRPRT